VPDPIGLSFMPGGGGGTDPNAQKPTPVQQAIQLLSLRIPRTVGAASGAPQSLLDSPGGSMLGGNPNSAAILEEIRRRLFGGGGAPPSGPFQPSVPRMPLPGAPPADEGGAPFGTPRVGFPGPGGREAGPTGPSTPPPMAPEPFPKPEPPMRPGGKREV
jgi:hypothetical protein